MLDIVSSYHCMQFQWKIMIQTSNSRNWQKTLFWVWFRLVGPKFGPPAKFVFTKIWLHQSVDIMISYHHVQYQKKIMIPSWENIATDGRTGRQTDEISFIGCYPTNVERPKCKYRTSYRRFKDILYLLRPYAFL